MKILGKFSPLTIFLSIFIIVSASFMRQAVDFFAVRTGRGNIAVFINWSVILSGVAFFIFLLRNVSAGIKILAPIVVLTGGLALTGQIKIPVERAHILEYALLGWFAAKDFIGVKRDFSGIALAGIFGFTVGVLDEAFQAVLPYRIFDLRDIAFNWLGSGWGIILYLLS